MNCRRRYWSQGQWDRMPNYGRDCPFTDNNDDDFFDCPMRGRMNNNNRCDRRPYCRRNPNCPFRFW